MRIGPSLGEINLVRFILAWCYDYVHYVRSLTIHIHIGLSKNILCMEYIHARTHARTHARNEIQYNELYAQTRQATRSRCETVVKPGKENRRFP